MTDSFDTYEFRQEVLKKGRLIGATAPCAETKGMWWQVYVHDGKVIALGMEHPCGVAFLEPVARHATELPINHLPQYCDDPSVARWAIENEADIRTHPTCLAGRS